MTEPVVIGNATLYLGDCREILPTLGNVDVVITSPPYAQQRDYGKKIDDWDSLMQGAFSSSLPDNCQILVNLGQIHRNGEVVLFWEKWREWMRVCGWRFFGQYVWDQNDGLPGDWNGRLAPSHEYILHFNKISRRPNKWVRVKEQRKSSGTGLRNPDGSMSGISSPEKMGEPYKIADSVVRVNREKVHDVDHPARFPIRFATELIASFSDHDQTILDQFMGSGTTGVACMNLGRKFIGIEIEPKYFDIACRRIEDAQRQGRMFA